MYHPPSESLHRIHKIMKFKLVCAVCLALAGTACGNKGPLFIPQKPAAAKSQPPATTNDDSKAPASGAKP
jgi:predicted small lipoprotein YifL